MCVCVCIYIIYISLQWRMLICTVHVKKKINVRELTVHKARFSRIS